MDTSQILDFLTQLQANNHKAWMDEHKPAYQQARNSLIEIADCLIQGLGASDANIKHLVPKSCVFRINRDIRFSKDKTPYKTFMGLFLSKEGRKSDYAGYYLHLAPYNQSFIAGGMYQPVPAILKQVRQEIDYNAKALCDILQEANFKKLFGSLQGETLQRPPKGYAADHPYIEWLKLKSFIVTHPVQDSEVLKNSFVDYVLATFQAMQPLNQFLNTALDN